MDGTVHVGDIARDYPEDIDPETESTELEDYVLEGMTVENFALEPKDSWKKGMTANEGAAFEADESVDPE